MADVTKLKSTANKGAPPPPDQLRTGKGQSPPVEKTNENLAAQPREKPLKKGKIEFSVPEVMLDDFAKEAGQRFGFKKGSKSDLFIAMWEEYKTRKSR